MAKTRTVFEVEVRSDTATYLDGSKAPPSWHSAHPKRYYATRREACEAGDELAESKGKQTRVVSHRWPAHRMLHTGANTYLDILAKLPERESLRDLSPADRREFATRAADLMEAAIPELRRIATE